MKKLVKKVTKVNRFLFLLVTSHHMCSISGNHILTLLKHCPIMYSDLCVQCASIIIYDEINEFGLSDIYK